jgi:hypothetical protein
MSTFAFTAENGIPFVARRVDKGENYGRDERIAHQEDDPLIEFYDTRHPHTKQQRKFKHRFEGIISLEPLAGAAVQKTRCDQLEDDALEATHIAKRGD